MTDHRPQEQKGKKKGGGWGCTVARHFFSAALLFPSLTRGSIVIPRDATASSGTSNFHHAVKAGGTSNFPHEAASNGTPWPPTQTSTCGRAPVYLRNFVFKVNSSFACLFFKLSAYFT